jgi:hypothetical protein
MRSRSRLVSFCSDLCLMVLLGAVFAASCAAFARSMILAKPRFAEGAPFAVEGGVGVNVDPGLCFDTASCMGRRWLRDVPGLIAGAC